MLQPVHRGRIHPDHQKVESSVGIEIRQRVAHAEGVRLGDPLAGHVGEMAVAVVPVKVNAGEIAHDQQVQDAVVIQINKRRAVNAPTAFLLQPGGHGRVGEIAMPVVQQQIREMSVIGIVKTGPQYLAEGGNSVLTEKHIEVAIAINVPASQRHGVGQAGTGRPHQPAGFVKCAARRAFEQNQPFGFRAQKVRDTVAVKVRDDAVENQPRRVSAQRLGLVAVPAASAINQVFRGENNFRQIVTVEIVENQWVDELGFFRRRDLFREDGLKGWFTAPCFDGQMGGIDPFHGRQPVARPW